MTMHVGFSGTQYTEQIKPKQIHKLADILQEVFDRYHSQGDVILHHGDCVGADTIASNVAKYIGYKIHIHPPINTSKRAFNVADYCYEPYDYLVRNKHMVDQSSVLLAMPKTKEEELRSGTWATIREARRQNKPVVIITAEE